MPASIIASPNGKPIEETLRARPTFGFIVNWDFTNPYSSSIWWGAVEAAEVLDLNLVGFGDIDIYDLQRNRSIYRQIQPTTLDGLVLLNPTFPRLHHDVFGPVPVVNIGFPAEDVVASIRIDNYGGMRTVVSHLIETHGCHRLAFIKGPTNNPDAGARFQAYADVLRLHGLAVDPDLVYQPIDWSPPTGQEAVGALLDDRGMQFEALIAANDNMALTAMEELQRRGMRVPYDVMVSGFDDIIEARTSTPPLTTIHQPLRQMGRLALETLLAHYQEKSVPQELVLPTTLMVRRSCGCFSESVLRVDEGLQHWMGEEAAGDGKTVQAGPLVEARREVFLAEVQRTMAQRDAALFPQIAEQWLESLTISLAQSDNGENFLKAIDMTSRDLIKQQIPIAELQDMLSILRRECCRALAGQPAWLKYVENLWHRARVFLDELVLQQQMEKRIQLHNQMAVLRDISQAMAVTFHLDNLMDILARDLKQLGIESCYVALYSGENRPAEWARLMLAYDKGKRFNLDAMGDKRRYPTTQLLPAELWGERRHTLMLAALEFQREEIGFVLFEVGPHDGAIYEALRSQLGSSIKGALLFDERDHLLAKTTQMYREATERQRSAEEANRLKSRFLSTVSHELRTPLNLITGLSELILWDADNQKPLNLENLERVHLTAQHLDGLIRDVLDLQRDEIGELRLACEPLDPAKILEAVVIVGEQLAREKGLDWQAQIPANLPLIWGDRTRLRQVVLNLINNAVKFTEKGRVGLQATSGNGMVAISVTDTGLGILPAEQSVIFDEFRQSDSTTARGYGGHGLGLAISKRLMKMHGGEIGVRSSGLEGEGATFHITLPALQVASSPAESTTAVWIITAQPENAQPLSQYLEQQGFKTEVLFWDENRQWLTRAEQTPPAALLLDINKTPELVWDAMRALKAYPTTADIMVLFYKLEAEQNSGAMLGLDYLTKPIAAPDLAQALRRMGFVERGAAPRDTIKAGKTILIVDDDPRVLDMHAQIVRSNFPQHEIQLASGGKEALRHIQTNPPDLVLLDLMMPEIDGFCVLESMQKMETARQIPVIVLTAQVLTEEEMARLNRSVTAVLSRGIFTSAETLEHLKDALALQQNISTEAQRLSRKAMAFIHEHYAEPIAREEIARYVGVSEGYLSRSFHQETGLSLKHYLCRYRIQQAKQLLAASEKTVTEIALEVGFSNSNYFSRIFLQEVGISPLAYRRTN